MDRRETEPPEEADYPAAVPLEIDEETAMRADDLLREFAEDAGLETALIVDRSGALVAGISAEAEVTVEVISALVAGASGAMRALVSRLGETGALESLHLGGDRLIYLREIVNRFILVAVSEVSRPAGLVRQKALAIGPRLDELLSEIRPQEVTPPQPARSLRAISRERAALREAGLAVVAVATPSLALAREDSSEVEGGEPIDLERIAIAEFPGEVPVDESFETLEFTDEAGASAGKGLARVADSLEPCDKGASDLPSSSEAGSEEDGEDGEDEGVSPFEAFQEEDIEELEAEPDPECVCIPKEILEPIEFGEPEIVVETSPQPPASPSLVMPTPVDSPFEAEEDEPEELLITLSPGAYSDIFEVEEDEEEKGGEASLGLEGIGDDEAVADEILDEEVFAGDLSEAVGKSFEATLPASLFETDSDEESEEGFERSNDEDGDDPSESFRTAGVFEVDLEVDDEVDLVEDEPFEEDRSESSSVVSPHLPEPEPEPAKGESLATAIEESMGGQDEEPEARSAGPFYF